MILLLRTHVVSCSALLTLAPIFIIHVCIIVITNDTIHVHTLFLHFMKEKQPSFVCTTSFVFGAPYSFFAPLEQKKCPKNLFHTD